MCLWKVNFTCPRHTATTTSEHYTMLFSRKWLQGQTFQKIKILLDIIIYACPCKIWHISNVVMYLHLP